MTHEVTGGSVQGRLGILDAGDPSGEQRPARNWCARSGTEVERVLIADIATDRPREEYDVQWWHLNGPLEGVKTVRECGPAVRPFLEDGNTRRES